MDPSESVREQAPASHAASPVPPSGAISDATSRQREAAAAQVIQVGSPAPRSTTPATKPS